MSFPLETKQRISTDVDLGHIFESLATGEGFVTKVIDNADSQRLGRKTVKVEYAFKTATAPTAGTTVQFYLVTADDNASQHVDGSFVLGASAVKWTSPSAGTQRDMVRFVHAQAVRLVANTTYKGSFEFAIPAARNWAIYVYNETGQALSAVAADHYLRYLVSSDYADAPKVNG
jgi:hypothetical protein